MGHPGVYVLHSVCTFVSRFAFSIPFLHLRVRVDNGSDVVNDVRSLVVQGSSEERDRIKESCDVNLGSARDAEVDSLELKVDELLQEHQPGPFREGEGCCMCLEIRLVWGERIRIEVEESFWE